MQIQLKKPILIPTVAFCILSLITSAFFILSAFYNNHHYLITYARADYTETSDYLDNPYRGWYYVHGYALSDSAPIFSDTIQKHIQTSSDHRLALLEINLSNYASGDLSAFALSQLDMILSAWEQSDQQLILRFLYDWDGHAKQTEPQSLPVIVRHMDQTAEVMNKHTAAIYILQGIFLGNYGEMHGSAHLTNDTIRTLTNHLHQIIDPSIYLSVRTPQQWRQATQSFEPLSKKTAQKETAAARIGLFNDGMLGSETDLGTYNTSQETLLPSAKAAADYSIQGSRSEELAFQNKLCSFVPNGGEAVIDNRYNDFPAAVSAFEQMHISYLNRAHDAAVLQKWEQAVYHGDNSYNGISGLDYMERHLGYRYVITDSVLTYTKKGKGPAVLSVSIANNGFSSCYRPFTAQLILRHTETGKCKTLTFQTDTRLWASGTTTELQLPIEGAYYEPGSYTVYFKLCDKASGEQIQLANTLKADSSFGYPIAALQIQK